MASHLENGESLSLFLYGERGVRVEYDGGAGGLGGELPFLWDPRSLSAYKGRMMKVKRRYVYMFYSAVIQSAVLIPRLEMKETNVES